MKIADNKNTAQPPLTKREGVYAYSSIRPLSYQSVFYEILSSSPDTECSVVIGSPASSTQSVNGLIYNYKLSA